ncbi:hypothetical protein BOH72_19560 [Mycobacterium sp. WY10]|nr:hypothetical protein BOH72_19560 [Mycobacterium sp. WY10]
MGAIGGAAMFSGCIGVCGCIACDAVLDNASVPADTGLPACAPLLKFWAKPSGESAFVGAEVEGTPVAGLMAPVEVPAAFTLGVAALTDGADI